MRGDGGIPPELLRSPAVTRGGCVAGVADVAGGAGGVGGGDVGGAVGSWASRLS